MLIFYLSLLETPDEKDKLRAIYESYHDLMMGVAFGFFRNEHDAQDAVQQAFMTLIENLKRISKVDCPETRRYCVIITRSRCLDMLRAGKKSFSAGDTDQVEADSTDFTDDSALFEAESDLQRALQKLSERYREALYMRLVDGYSTREIAKMSGINEAAAQKLIWRAKEALRKAYREIKDEQDV